MSPEFDFVRIKETFDGMSSGGRAEISRAELPSDLVLRGALYRLLPEGEPPSSQWQRVVFLLPWAKQEDGASQLGRQMAYAERKISEQRVFQTVRSDYPQDILHMRRLLRYLKIGLDWNDFGKTLWFWGEVQKRRIVESYFMAKKSSYSEEA
ncbi:type I-E CRISPR-associated protein Cse2/CasB [Dethiosulfovibrio sp. F2B]|uniref:type I-E CRISPR-associated protein Cse2/CasB n=1 Tax=Dethiosulfovibrio faecalis TaxID=2720018 RepID=UPI001F3FCD2B|nr:type I-E CRISPR-associated protein Cse2/CasB [Dethiosulfovibrio faecalis]MCF4152270.1 type I-E CRISPR-associated protein Cse2/CasB [Dethiosulfovibrio faecalis]